MGKIGTVYSSDTTLLTNFWRDKRAMEVLSWTPLSDTTFNAELAQAIASSRPERILLQTSDLENAAKEIKRFRDKGYMLRKTIPLDLEPGTAGFELLMLFVPDRAGLLGGFGAKKAGKRPVQRPVERVTPQNRGDIPHFVQKSSPRRQRKD